MKILLYSTNYAPELTGVGKYSGEMAAWLAKAGHEVRVVAAPPYYPAWRVADSHSASRYSQEVLDGVTVFRAPLWVPSKPGGLSRVLHLLTFAASSWPLMLRQVAWRPDVVMTVAPAFVCAPAGWLTARLSGAKSWLHVQDFEVDVAFRIGLLKEGWMSRVVRPLERALFRRFDRVSSISGRMLQQALSKGVESCDLRLLPNWVDVDAIKPLHRTSAYRAELGIPEDAIVALYSGSLGGKHGLMMIPEAARQLAGLEKLALVICGEGALKEALQEACADLPNVRLLPLQPAARLGELLGMADIHLLPQSEGVEDLVMPSKLTGMLASGKPVVATCRPDTEIAHAVTGRGLFVAPGDASAFAEAIRRLAVAAPLRAEMGQSARAFAEDHLACNAILGRLAEDLEALVRSRRGSIAVTAGKRPAV